MTYLGSAGSQTAALYIWRLSSRSPYNQLRFHYDGTSWTVQEDLMGTAIKQMSSNWELQTAAFIYVVVKLQLLTTATEEV